MTAEQWLSDLEAKAKAAEVTELKIGFPTAQDFDVQRDFAESATPTAVLRLVAMVRIIADRAGKTMFALSLRPGRVELFGLLWTAFNWRRGCVLVRQGKSGRVKTVFPPQEYMAEAKFRYDEDVTAGIPWVCHRDAKRVLSYSGAWKRALQDAGLPHFPMYHIRHGAATEMLAAGADPASVAAQLGHSTVTTTCTVYAHVTAGGQKRAAALMPSIDDE